MRHAKSRFPAKTRAALKSAGRSGAVIKARNPNFPDLVPDRPLKRDHSLQPWPLDESDLPHLSSHADALPSPACGESEARGAKPAGGEGAYDAMPPINFLGCLTAAERGVQGNVTLDVLLHPDGSCEIGPFVFPRPQVTQLLRLVMAADVLREAWA